MKADGPAGTRPGREMRSNLRIALLMLSAIGLLAVTAGMIAFNVSGKTLSHQNVLQRTFEQRAQIRDVLSKLGIAEVSQSKFRLTGDEHYANRFRSAEEKFPGALERLRALFRGDPDAYARARSLADLASTRMRELADTLAKGDMAEPGGAGSTNAIVPRGRADAARQTIGRINRLAKGMILATERENLEASRTVHERIEVSRLLVLGLLALIVLLVTVVVVLALTYLGQRARVEMELRQAMAMTRQASEAKTQFVASMSHEIRTPLTGILGYTELLLEEDLPPHQRDYVEHLQTAGVGLSTLIDGVLELSKIERREISIVEEPLSLGPLVANVLSIVSLTAQTKNVRLESELDPALPATVLGAEKRLRQILLNLLANALKFTREGTVTLRVMHRGSAESGEIIHFEVADTGIGIARDRQDQLFRRFSQAAASTEREYGGTGLGLAISKKLVVLMGGMIGVESEEGRGSTFWFTLPMGKTDAPLDLPADEHELAPAAGGRILLVEDSPQNQDLVCAMLSKQGYHVDVAENGEDGVAAARAHPYGLILMDMQMPRMDGVEATRRIRAEEGAASRLPILAMTATVLPEQRTALRDAGVSDYIAKPFNKAELLATIGRWIYVSVGQPATTECDARTALDDRALAALRELMGSEWVRTSLVRLSNRIDEALAESASGRLDRARLKHHAHRIVSDAGQLGFVELSRACADLEEACESAEELGPALDRTRQAAARVRAIFDELLEPAGNG